MNLYTLIFYFSQLFITKIFRIILIIVVIVLFLSSFTAINEYAKLGPQVCGVHLCRGSLIFNEEVYKNLGKHTYSSLSFLVLLLMVEIFLRFKIARMRPNLPISGNYGTNGDGSLTFKAQEVLLSLTTKNLVRSLERTKSIQFFLQKSGISQKDIQYIDVSKNDLKQKSFEIAKEIGGQYVTTVDVFIAYLLLTEEKTKVLFSKELKNEEVMDILHWTRIKFRDEEFPKPIKIQFWGKGFADDWMYGWTLETQKCTSNFTDTVLLRPHEFVGRIKEYELFITALSKDHSRNALLVGNPGVGKTSLVSHFALESFLGKVPNNLSHKRVLELSVGSLLAGIENQGVLEERIKNIIEELEHAGDVVLYIPSFETIAGGGGFSFDATGVLLPALRGNKIQIIGTTTPTMYKQYLEKRIELKEVFEAISIEEPTLEEAIRMLEEASIHLEKKHRVHLSYKALKAVLELSSQYVPDTYLPGKAIQLLDDLAASMALQKKYIIEKEDVVSRIEEKIHVRVGKPKEDEQQLLLHLEELLHSRIIGQEEAVKTVSSALRRVRSGITNKNRPTGVFLFLGPTGVGKTELSKALAAVYFGRESDMVRIDMGAYKDAQSINRLIGAPPGSIDSEGELTQAIRKQPFSLLLLDEFEKAHPDVLDLFLPIFDEGKLTDAHGKSYSFTNSIIIATSNAGSETIREKLAQNVDLQQLKPLLLDQLQKEGKFKPELLNRFDAIVVFEPLKENEIKEVVKLLLQDVIKKLKEQDINVAIDESAIDFIVKQGFDREFGARPLRRYIQDTIENMLADKILKQEVQRGSTVTVIAENNSIVVR